jgi:enoyl-CoA hydratase/carnithine racemase
MIESESRGAARWIFIANPRVINAVGIEDLQRLREEVEITLRDPSTALIVLAGRGGNFSSGDNLKESRVMDRLTFRSLIAAFQELSWTVEHAAKPIAAFVEGYALGGGAEIALMCDFVVAERSATVGFPEIGLGGMISNASSAFLGDALGLPRASELVLLSQRRRADDPALAALFNFVGSHDDCVGWLDRAADQLAASPPAAVARGRDALRAPGRAARMSALTQELIHAMELFELPDYKEATAAFANKHARQGGHDDRSAANPDR